MELPAETHLDSFRCLDRPSLDAVQFSTKHFRNSVEKLSDVCLRRLKHACVGVGFKGTELLPHSYTVQATLQDNELTKHTVATEEDAGKFFTSLIASSFIERCVIVKVRLTDRLLLPLQVAVFGCIIYAVIPSRELLPQGSEECFEHRDRY